MPAGRGGEKSNNLFTKNGINHEESCHGRFRFLAGNLIHVMAAVHGVFDWRGTGYIMDFIVDSRL